MIPMTAGDLIRECCQVIFDLRFNDVVEVGLLRDAMKVSLHMAVGEGWRWN